MKRRKPVKQLKRKLSRRKRLVSLPPVRLFPSSRSSGHAAGYEAGYRHGKFLGLCEGVRRSILPQLSKPFFDIKVLYVCADSGFPYFPLEQGILEALNGMVREVVTAQPGENIAGIAEQVRPALMLQLSGNKLPLEQVQAVRALGIKTAVWFADDPYYTEQTQSISKAYDYVFTLEPNIVGFYQSLGVAQAHFLPFAVSPSLFKPQRVDTSYRTDICFIGSAFSNRVPLIDSLAHYLSGKNVKIIGYWWERLSNYHLLADKIVPLWLSPEETAKYYHGAKIVINIHRAFDDTLINSNSHNLHAHGVNPRTFDITACGTLQITDVRNHLPHTYQPGVEVETYSSKDELVDKIEHYLAHEDQRQQIALNGLRRTLQEHNFINRMTQLLQVVTK